MELKIFKTLWGHEGSLDEAISQAVEARFHGIEGQAPVENEPCARFNDALRCSGLQYIAEITTAGSYVPSRHASLQEHLDDFEKKLESSLQLNPIFITCLGGCDAWPEEKSLLFFEKAIRLAESANISICFETHRSRSLFNPWVTDRIVKALPEIKLTCDFSHWCVVCERLMDSEQEVLERISKNAHHIHVRVGYEQGPQVPHPAAPEYQYALRAHQRWWELIWQAQKEQSKSVVTVTPEFGPDGYLHHAPFTNEPVADLWELNRWIADEERQHFIKWCEYT